MTFTLPHDLAERLEAIAAEEQRTPEAVLQTMFTQYHLQLPESQVPDESLSERERVRRRLLAAGRLATGFHAPPDAVQLTVEERMKLGTLPPGARSSLDLINEDRGEW